MPENLRAFYNKHTPSHRVQVRTSILYDVTGSKLVEVTGKFSSTPCYVSVLLVLLSSVLLVCRMHVAPCWSSTSMFDPVAPRFLKRVDLGPVLAPLYYSRGGLFAVYHCPLQFRNEFLAVGRLDEALAYHKVAPSLTRN